jgi:hypothetical protein
MIRKTNYIMKKVAFIAIAAFGLTSLSSCTKDWECECTLGSGNTQLVTTETIETSSLKKARQECEDKDQTTWGTCVLKP